MQLSNDVLQALGKFEVAFVTLFAGLLIAKIVGKITRHIFREAELNRIMESAGFRPMSDTLGNIIEYVLYFLTLLAVLRQFGLTTIVFEIIGVVLGVALVISIILSIRDFFPNLIAGFYLRKDLRQSLGKRVKIGVTQGTLVKIGFLGSIIKSQDEEYVPHRYSLHEKIKRIQAG